MAVATAGLAASVGDRLATVQEYQESIGVGSGTVRKAIKDLEDAGALFTKKRGHQGTVVTGRDVGLLWKLSGRSPLRVAMTPPGAPDQIGLTKAVAEQFEELGMIHVPQFIRGARRRIRQLLRGETDLITLSEGAAGQLNTSERRRLSIAPVSPLLYYGLDFLVTVDAPQGRQRRRPLRVGIDRDSRDHVALTELVYGGQEVRYVDCPFLFIPRAVLADVIDTGVWHRLQTLIPPELAGLQVRLLGQDQLKAIPQPVLGAALAWRKDDHAVASVVRDFDTTAMGLAQHAVMTGSSDDDIAAELLLQ